MNSFLKINTVKNDGLLDRVLSYPNINSLTLRFLHSRNIFLNLVFVNKTFYKSIPGKIIELDIELDILEKLISTGSIFTCLKKIECMNGFAITKEVVLTANQFPALQTVKLGNVFARMISIQAPILQKLKTYGVWNHIDDLKVQGSSLRTITGSFFLSIVRELLKTQPNLETFSVNIVKKSVLDFEEEIKQDDNILHIYQTNLRVVRIDTGLNQLSIRIQSLENIEELKITEAHVLVKEHAIYSNIRWLSLSKIRGSMNEIFGYTKFPLINFFHVQGISDCASMRVYQDCVTRDQNRIKPYHSKHSSKASFTAIKQGVLYCNGWSNAHEFALHADMNNVFIANVPKLRLLSLHGMMKVQNIYHFSSQCTRHLDKLEITVGTMFTVNLLYDLVRTQQIKMLIIQCCDQILLDSISQLLRRTEVDSIKFYITTPLQNTLCLKIEELQKLRKFVLVVHSVEFFNLDIQCINLPLLSILDLKTTSDINISPHIFVEKAKALKTIYNEFKSYSISTKHDQAHIEVKYGTRPERKKR